MSDQNKGEGHHAVTREAVHELFTSGRGEIGADGQIRIRGLTEDEYFNRLDEAQEFADRIVGGDTWHDARLDPDAQRRHAMADPRKSGEENVEDIKHFISGELKEAHIDGSPLVMRDDEMRHLGAAAHALEDSYSNAHEFRGDAVFEGDPTAPIKSLNVFHTMPEHHGPGGAADFGQGTHDHYLDHVPVGHGMGEKDQWGIAHNADGSVPLLHHSDEAAAHATAEMLERYEDAFRTPENAEQTLDHAVDEFFRTDAAGVTVQKTFSDPSFQQELDRRVHIEQSQEHAAAKQDAQRHGQVYHLGYSVHGQEGQHLSMADHTGYGDAGAEAQSYESEEEATT